jgi:hypothetical protein
MLFGRAVVVALFCATAVHTQEVFTAPRKLPDRKPACAAGAICFSGEVFSGKEFRRSINASLEFVLEPGWNIAVVPKRPEGDCKEFASVVNAPYRAHRALYIDMSYGWTAENEVDTSPRTFYFVTNCGDYRTESERLNIVLWGYTHTEEEYKQAVAELGSSPLGTGRFWITASKVTHALDTSDNRAGKIEWMQFAVEIKLPK